MVWSPGAVSFELLDVPQRQIFPMLLFIFLYALGQIHRSQIPTLTIFFYMNIEFDKLLIEIDNVLQKGECKLSKSA